MIFQWIYGECSMEELKKTDFRLPIEWIDRIFQRLHAVWGDHYLRLFANPQDLEFERTRWQGGLHGVTAEEIKNVLSLCQTGKIKSPPNVIEFFHYCKGYKIPPPQKPAPYATPKREVGEQYLKLLRDKLHGKLNSDGHATLSALDKQILDNTPNKKPLHWQDD
jgi:hypothetical protein